MGNRAWNRVMAVTRVACVPAMVIFVLCYIPRPAWCQQPPAFYPTHEWFWFIYERNRTDRYSDFTVRPFYTRHQRGVNVFSASLMPVVFWNYQDDDKNETRGLFGFVDSLDFTHPGGVRDYDLGVFPFLYYGNSPDARDRYMMVWPAGGTLRGKIGQEYITAWAFPGVALFFLFPPWVIASGPVVPVVTVAWVAISFMPLYAEYGRGDYHATGIVWPLVTWGEGNGRHILRVLPFYARSVKDGWYDNRSYGLLVNKSETYFRDGRVHHVLFVVPFYGRKWSTTDDMASTTILWPFFSWGYNRKNGEKEWNMPWPLVQIKDCREPYVRKRIYFPFYGDYRYKNERTFFVTPLYFTLENNGSEVRSAYYYVCIIGWYFRRDYSKPHERYGTSWRYYKLWPLVRYEYNDMGDSTFNLLSLLPLRDPEGYEALYEPLWTIVEYRTFSDGNRRFGFLLRTYYQCWGPGYFQAKVPLLFSIGTIDGRVRHWSFLAGLAGYSHEKKGKYISILWIPFRTGDADPALASRDVNPSDGIEVNPPVGESSDRVMFMAGSLPVFSPAEWRITFSVF